MKFMTIYNMIFKSILFLKRIIKGDEFFDDDYLFSSQIISQLEILIQICIDISGAFLVEAFKRFPERGSLCEPWKYEILSSRAIATWSQN